MYTAQTGKGALFKFLPYISNKYNFGNLNISYTLITALDEPFFPLLERFLPEAKEIISDPLLSNKLCDKVRRNYVS
jgi:hypothetical protein